MARQLLTNKCRPIPTKLKSTHFISAQNTVLPHQFEAKEPVMPINEYEFTAKFEQVLSLSKVDATQSVAVLKSHYSNPPPVKAATNAALRLGAKVYIVELHSFNHPQAMGIDMTAYCGDTALTGNLAAQRALEAADLIVDTMMLLHSPEQEQILKTGTRILLAV